MESFEWENEWEKSLKKSPKMEVFEWENEWEHHEEDMRFEWEYHVRNMFEKCGDVPGFINFSGDFYVKNCQMGSVFVVAISGPFKESPPVGWLIHGPDITEILPTSPARTRRDKQKPARAKSKK